MPQRQTRIAKLTRVCTLEGETLFFTMPATGRKRAAADFLRPDQVPPFEGRTAWFEVEHVPAKPWGFWRALRQVEDRG